MTTATPETIRIDVGGVELGAVRWSGAPGAPVVFATHGITANAWSWSAVARHLDGDVGLVSLDLRGRGRSHDAPGPYGIRQHADDVAAVVQRLNAAPAVVTGHSMGTYVAMAVAERHPDVIADLVLVDGGPSLPMPEGLTPADALDALLGPAIERLQRVWPDRVTYSTMWSEHPAFGDGLLTPEVERYVLSDLTPCDGGFKSIVNEEAVRIDGTDLQIDEELRGLFDRRTDPTVIIRAELGIMGDLPAFIPPETVERYPKHDWRTVTGSNHYSVLIGETGAQAIAEALREAVSPQW